MRADGSSLFRKVAERLSQMTCRRDYRITEDTEVFGDLCIWGDEIVELVWWLDKEFGLKSAGIDPFHFAPKEGNFSPLQRALRKFFGIKPLQYESLKVRDIIAAIEAGRWPDSAA